MRLWVVADAVGPEFYPLKSDSGTPDSGTSEVLAKYGVNLESPFVLYVGGISPHKNLLTLVQAHAALQRETETPKANLVLLGDHKQLPPLVITMDLPEVLPPTHTASKPVK